jgi:hypothetical protein
MISLLLIILVIALLAPTKTVFAQDTSDPDTVEALPWWQVVTGILAIPAALIGLVYTYRLSQKTRLEARKLQLEILEKEGKTRKADQKIPEYKEIIKSPQAVAASVQDFVIRFIILYLANLGWGLIASFITPLVGALSAYWIMQQNIDLSESLTTLLGVNFVTQITSIGNWIIFFVLGLPLLSDITRSVGFDPIVRFRKLRKDGE